MGGWYAALTGTLTPHLGDSADYFAPAKNNLQNRPADASYIRVGPVTTQTPMGEERIRQAATESRAQDREGSAAAEGTDVHADDAKAAAHATTREAHSALVERLFREHNESLLRFLASRLPSRQDAREIAQEAYVRVLSLDKPGAVSYLRAFLFKTAANLAVDRQRRSDVRQRAADEPLFHEFADSCTPERELVGKQAMERLARLVTAMPASCRRAFVLNRVHGMDFPAIAREMNVSERSARAYVVRALLYCRAGLDEET